MKLAKENEEWTLPKALKDLTDAIKALPDYTPKLELIANEIKALGEFLPKVSSDILSSLGEMSSMNRKALTDAVQEILRVYREEMEKSRVREKVV